MLLRLAKERGERAEAHSDIAQVAEEMGRDTFEAELNSKMDLLFDNHTDQMKKMHFPAVNYNCGKLLMFSSLQRTRFTNYYSI